MSHPRHHGLPEKFSEWRRGQERALNSILYTRDRFSLLNIPVGGGKSAIYMGTVLTDQDTRACIITATRHLMDQLMGDFETTGLVDMRGRQNYVCAIDEARTAATAKCTRGWFCEFMKKPGCDYYDRKWEAGRADQVVTNYAYWLATEESDALGSFGRLILDEAHQAADEIAKFAQVEVTRKDLERWDVPLPDKYGRAVKARINEWAPRAIDILDKKKEGLAARDGSGRKNITDLSRKLRRLCRLSEQDWLFSRVATTGWRWDLIEPGVLAEDLLFRGAKSIVLSSATVNRMTLKTLGVDDKVTVVEQESTFPVRNRPIYYWPVARVDRNTSPLHRGYWHRAIDDIVRDRLDRKGIIHAVSYDRVWEIFYASTLRGRANFILHKRGETATEVLKRFDAAGPGAVLVTPAMDQGVDFPYRRAEYQIIAKVPFPDSRDKLVEARKRRNKDYVAYVTMTRIVQMSGRIVRAIDDRGETFILDDHFGWLRAGYWDFAPRYFHSAIVTLPKRDSPPGPPPPLRMVA